MATIGNLTAHLGVDNSRLISGLKQSRTSMGRFVNQSNAGMGSVVKSANKLKSTILSLGIAMAAFAAFKGITDIGSKFEYTMATVGGVMRATTEELDTLTAAAREMGEATEYSASQAGDALKFLGMAGFDTTKAIGALPGVLDLATAGGVELGRSADIASNALTAMGLPVEELSRVNDVFIGTMTRSNVNMEQMAESFKYGAPIAKAFGYSIEELSGMIGTLGNAGIQGSMGGTQLAMAIQKANKVAIKFGYESSDLVDVLEKMGKEGRTNTDIMEAFGDRAGRAALVLKDAIPQVKAFQETLGGVAGEAKVLADKMRNTFEGTKKELASVLESIKIDIFGTYKEGLRDSMRDSIEWLRSNKETIIKWADITTSAFGAVFEILSGFASVIGEVLGGIGEIFDALFEKTEATTKSMVQNGKDIEKSFSAPDFEPWQEFLLILKQTAKNVAVIFKGVSKAVMALVTGLVDTIVNDIFGNLLEASFSFALAIEKLLAFDFSGAWADIKVAGETLTNIWTDAGKTGRKAAVEMGNAFNETMDSFDWRTMDELISDVKIDVAFRKAADEKQDIVAGEMGIHTAKEVSLTTTGDMAAAQKAMSQLLDTRTMLLRNLLNSENQSKEDMKKLWAEYEISRIAQIDREAAALAKMGIETSLITKNMIGSMIELGEEQKALFESQGTWLRNWAEEIASDMHSSMSDMFFGILKGEFTSLTDYFSNVWDNMLRKLADSATDELFSLFEKKEGGGGLGGLMKLIPGFASGGIVSGPTLAMVGEAGPEAIIPLDKMRDEAFLNQLGSENGGNINVTMNVQTPDLPSFKQSQTQIMAQLSVALQGAHRRST